MRRLHEHEVFALMTTISWAVLCIAICVAGERRIDTYMLSAIATIFVSMMLSGVENRISTIVMRILKFVLATIFVILATLRVLSMVLNFVNPLDVIVTG